MKTIFKSIFILSLIVLLLPEMSFLGISANMRIIPYTYVNLPNISLFCSGDTVSGNTTMRHEPLIGMGGDPQTTTHVYLKKGEKYVFSSYGSDPEEICTDSVAKAWDYLYNVTHPEKHWINVSDHEPAFVSDTVIFPIQVENYGWIQLYIDTKDLNVEDTESFQYQVCSETTGGPFSVRTCVTIWPQYVHVIPYVINGISANANLGSYHCIQLNWHKPLIQFWNLNHYAILQRDNDSIRISELDSCTKIIDNLLPNDTSFTYYDGKRGLASFYSIIGYDSLGQVIAISNPVRPSYLHNSFSLISPQDGSVLKSLNPTFSWDSVPGKTYELWYSEDSLFSNNTVIPNIIASHYSLTGTLSDHHTYYWKVRTNDSIFSNETGWRFSTNVNNLPPGSFSLLSPAYDSSIIINPVNFLWNKSSDPGDSIYYKLVVSNDSNFMNAPIVSVQLTNNYFLPMILLPDDTTLYWKVTAYDTEHDSVTSLNNWKFIIHKDNPPLGFSLVYPKYNSQNVAVETGYYPTFIWRAAKNINPGDQVRYSLYYSTNASLSNPIIINNLTDTTYTPVNPLMEDSTYYWKVKAINLAGNETWSYGLPYSFIVHTYNRLPGPFSIDRPLYNQNIPIGGFNTSWKSPADEKYDVHLYYIYFSTDSTFTGTDTIYLGSDNYSNYPTFYLGASFQPSDYYEKVKCESKHSDPQYPLGCLDYLGYTYSYINYFHLGADTLLYNPFISGISNGNLQISVTYYLMWYYLNVSTLRIEFSYDGGATWSIWKDSVPATSNGNFPVRIPDHPTNSFKIRVSDLDDSRAYDISQGPYSIVPPIKQLNILHPNNGDSLKATAPYTIEWTKNNVDSVSLFYSFNNGGNWIQIADKVGGTSYPWMTPETPSDSCLFAIRDYFYPPEADTSTGFFKIIPCWKIHVSVTGNDLNGDGTILHPYATIQKAVNVAQSYDSILISAGTYYESVVFPSSSSLYSRIRGGYDPNTWVQNKNLFPAILNPQNGVGINYPGVAYPNIDDLVFNNASTGINENNNTNLIIRNSDFNNCGTGISLGQSTINLDKCKFSNCNTGVNFINPIFSSSTISNCIFNEISNSCLYFFDSWLYPLNIINNTFANSGQFLAMFSDFGSIINSHNNILYYSTHAININGYANLTTNFSNNLYFHNLQNITFNGNIIPFDSNDLLVYPFFTDTISGDFHLEDNSPCIGKGLPNNFTSDFDGNPRPNPPGSFPDIGAYENPLAFPLTPLFRIWNGSLNNYWENAGNWTPSGIPSSVDTVFIPDSVSIMPIIRSDSLSCQKLIVGNNALLNLDTNSKLTVRNNLIIDWFFPVVETLNPSNISDSSAVSGGTVVYSGGMQITERGICYSQTSSPTISDQKVLCGTGMGSFNATLTGLSPATKYYIRAFAINNEGIGYGNQEIFTTIP
jgi:hypothetical protein